MSKTENVELTVLCLIEDGDKILLQNRVKKDWRGYALPGGHVEPGESFVDAVIREMKELYTKVRVQKDVLGYMMDIVEKTRTESRFVTGVSTRGAIALYKASQAMAASLGRDFVIPEDVKAAAPWVLSHRIISRGGESFEDARKYLGQIMEDIPVPMENLR